MLDELAICVILVWHLKEGTHRNTPQEQVPVGPHKRTLLMRPHMGAHLKQMSLVVTKLPVSFYWTTAEVAKLLFVNSGYMCLKFLCINRLFKVC